MANFKEVKFNNGKEKFQSYEYSIELTENAPWYYNNFSSIVCYGENEEEAKENCLKYVKMFINDLMNFIEEIESEEPIKLIGECEETVVKIRELEGLKYKEELIDFIKFMDIINEAKEVEPTDEEKEITESFDNDVEEQDRIKRIIEKRRTEFPEPPKYNTKYPENISAVKINDTWYSYEEFIKNIINKKGDDN